MQGEGYLYNRTQQKSIEMIRPKIRDCFCVGWWFAARRRLKSLIQVVAGLVKRLFWAWCDRIDR